MGVNSSSPTYLQVNVSLSIQYTLLQVSSELSTSSPNHTTVHSLRAETYSSGSPTERFIINLIFPDAISHSFMLMLSSKLFIKINQVQLIRQTTTDNKPPVMYHTA